MDELLVKTIHVLHVKIRQDMQLMFVLRVSSEFSMSVPFVNFSCVIAVDG